MKNEYDFSPGERGKFYRAEIKSFLPIHLEPEVMAFVEKLAEKKGTDVSTVVNELFRGIMLLVQTKK